MKKEKLLCIFLLIISSTESHDRKKLPSLSSWHYHHTQRPTSFQIPSPTPYEARNFAYRACDDFYSIGKEFFAIDSMKIISMIAPFYIIGRRVDEPIHKKFYNQSTHKNTNQPPRWIKDTLLHAVPVIPAVTYGVMGSFHGDSHARRTAQIFVAGYLWTWGTKIIVKLFKTGSNLRPHNGNFKNIPTYGGNPSGHTSTAAFYTTYLGLTRGPRWGIPLGIVSAGVGTLGFITNRHYFSQIISGAGLGIIIGSAAYRVLERIPEPSNFDLSFNFSGDNGTGLTLAYSF